MFAGIYVNCFNSFLTKLFLFLLIILLIPFGVFATTFFVDGPNPAASDSNPGSEVLPFKSIQKGVDVAVAGDRVFVKAGVYAENLVMKNSGVEASPIVIEGQRGQNGERLVTIEAGFLAKNWIPAPEIGQGVYKKNFVFRPYAYRPSAITVDGMNLDSIVEDADTTNPSPNMSDDSWKVLFNSTLDLNYDVDNPEHCGGNPACNWPIRFWDLTYGIFGYKSDGNTYVRLKDRSNPNNYNTRVSDSGQTILFDNHHHITFKGFKLKSFSIGFRIIGANTHHIIIEDNFVSGNLNSITIGSGTHDIIVRNNELNYDHYGFKNTGTWRGSTDYEDGLMQAFYQWQHHWIFKGSGLGISIGGGVSDIEISKNFIHEGMNGFSMDNEVGTISSRIKISENKIEDFSSVGIVVRAGLVDLEIFDNNFYNNHINIRLHELDVSSPRKVFIYKNFFRQPEDAGSHFWFHWFSNKPVPNPQPEGYIYHNSFSGGNQGVALNSYGDQYGLIPNFFIINNLISGPRAVYPQGSNISRHFMGSFNYNWVGNLVKGLEWKYGVGVIPPWFGVNNIQSGSNYFWLPAGGVDFNISADSNVVDRGLDLSVVQDVNGRLIGPLPGITSGYYCGSLPDVGAVQFCPLVDLCGDGLCDVNESIGSCVRDCNGLDVNCGVRGRHCDVNGFCDKGVCVLAGCSNPALGFNQLRVFRDGWVRRNVLMVDFMKKILEWKRCKDWNN